MGSGFSAETSNSSEGVILSLVGWKIACAADQYFGGGG